MVDIYDIEDKMAEKKHRGPVFRKFLHLISLFYCEDLEESYKIFLIDCLPKILPCSDCAEHYKQYIEKNPPKLEGRDEFMEWLLEFHNFGSRMGGKPEYTMDMLLDAIDKY